MLDQCYKVHLQKLLRLHQATPAPAVFLIAGSLPLSAKLHLRMFSLFGQLSRLREGDNILAKHAGYIFSSTTPSSGSWFWKLRQLCLMYGLPHPASWLSSRPSKLQMKTMSKAAVLQYWLNSLRSQAEALPSLQYLQTKFLGLTKCHPIFRSCGSSPWEVEKATTQARLLSGRYRLESLTKHWVPWNRKGLCSLPDCWESSTAHIGTIECFLLSCPSLSPTRLALADYTACFKQLNPHLTDLLETCMALDPVQFLLDCSTMAPVISATQQVGEESVLNSLFKFTRNICHCLHKARMSVIRDK